MKISKRDSSAILEAISGGVVPPRGLQHIMVGRTEEAKQILTDLNSVKSGASIMKFFIGDYGTGKSFLQHLVKQVAFKHNFVVTQADFSTEKRLVGENRGRALYTELVNNLSTRTSLEEGALSIIIDKWITTILEKVKVEYDYSGIDFSNKSFVADVQEMITSEMLKMDGLAGGFDFSRILNIYFKGYVTENNDIQRKALRWIRGEYSTKTEARVDLGVREIINDQNYYDYIKVLSQFVKHVGYDGLVVNFDEAVNLYKIDHTQSRARNYEAILTMFNDCHQGTFEGLYITFSGTPDFLQDERRGLYSYGALRRRLEVNRYETEEYRDLTQPVIMLAPLKQEELYVLLQRLRDIHAKHYDYKKKMKDEHIKLFIVKEFSLPGAEQFTTVGHVVKRYLDLLNVAYQNPEFSIDDILNDKEKETESQSDIMQRFSRT